MGDEACVDRPRPGVRHRGGHGRGEPGVGGQGETQLHRGQGESQVNVHRVRGNPGETLQTNDNRLEMKMVEQ